MSIEALNWALGHIQRPDIPTRTRFVLMILANRADPEGSCWPSVRYIMARTGLSERAVRESCKEILDWKLMEIREQRRVDGGKTSNHYILCLKTPPPAPGAPTPGTTCTYPPAPGAPTPGTTCTYPPAPGAPHDTKGLDVPPPEGGGPARKKKTQKTTLPEGFTISDRVAKWANEKGYITTYLQECMEGFILNATAKCEKYANWDAAFMTWVRREPHFSRRPAPTSAGAQAPGIAKRCAWTDGGKEPRCTATEHLIRMNATDFLCEPHNTEYHRRIKSRTRKEEEQPA